LKFRVPSSAPGTLGSTHPLRRREKAFQAVDGNSDPPSGLGGWEDLGRVWEGWSNFDGILEVDMVLDVLSKWKGKLAIRVSQRQGMGKLKTHFSTKKQNTPLPTTNVSMVCIAKCNGT